MNIVFWNCQGLKPKRKELQNYLLENQIDILALNETFLKPKFKFHLPGYDIHKNDRLVDTKGGVAILVKKGIIVNQEWKNEHFNVITDNEALAMEIELQNGDLLSYYPRIKFLGITFDNRMTFTKHFEEILECCNQKFHRLRILVNKKWGPSPETILQIYKQCVRPIFEYGIVSTITVSLG